MTITTAAHRASAPQPGAILDVDRVRAEVPILARSVRGKPLAYLDNAATTQKPTAVIEAVAGAYRECYANVHRGLYDLAERTTAAFEAARGTVQRWLCAERPEEVVFVRGTTEAINLVATSFLRPRLFAGDEVLITSMEHHSNIVPWQLVCAERGARLVVAPVDDRGELIVEEYERLLSERTRMVGMVHVSNALGTINPVRRLVEAASSRGIPTLVDGAQAMPHLPVDVAELGCDFYAFSGHKVYGPTGIGVLWGRYERLAAMPPYQSGGEMIRTVTFERSEYKAPPHRFEAGTPNIVGAIGLAAALDWLRAIGLGAARAHEEHLLGLATERLSAIPGLRLIGTARSKAAVASFVLAGVHPHDIATILDREGIAVRAGHHCAQPLMERFGVPATARASFAVYNTEEEVERLASGLARVREVFGE